jgi:hypothetical protein
MMRTDLFGRWELGIGRFVIGAFADRQAAEAQRRGVSVTASLETQRGRGVLVLVAGLAALRLCGSWTVDHLAKQIHWEFEF